MCLTVTYELQNKLNPEQFRALGRFSSAFEIWEGYVWWLADACGRVARPPVFRFDRNCILA